MFFANFSMMYFVQNHFSAKVKIFLWVVSLLVVTSCSNDETVDDKYLPCAQYLVVSERELPLVKCDQSRLIGKLQEILGIPVTEKFDVGTAIAVEKFQISQGLLVSGSIDVDTINRISETFGNGLNGEACIFNISQPSRPWKKCDFNNEIIPFQRFMGIEADGFIGPGTVKAIIAFQNQYGLVESGVLDESTWKIFVSISS
jgi:peptidoglycan hydrolase-like protein with peptidoglycan-binding domain